MKEAAATVEGVEFSRLYCERLADMNLARGGHAVFYAGECITVFGGHTTGFVPTPTAEYYKDGVWHFTDPMHYSHDHPFALRDSAGRILLGGGSEDSFGIGQSWGVESYNPENHSFSPVGILDRKRALSSAVLLEDGSVLVAGNWYAPDALALFRPEKGFTELKTILPGGPRPYLLPSGKGKALCIYTSGTRGETIQPCIFHVNEGMTVPDLPEGWAPAPFLTFFDQDNYRIAPESYLLPVFNSIDGSCAILHVSGNSFSLLPTWQAIPTVNPLGEKITWSPALMADRDRRCALLPGTDESRRMYILKIGYDAILVGGKASLSVFWISEDIGVYPQEFSPVLLPDGGIAIAGGVAGDNFNPLPSAFILRTEQPARQASSVWIIVAAIIVLALVAAAFLIFRKRSESGLPESPRTEADLMTRIRIQMEKEQLYRKKGLTKAELATILGTNATYISACINTQFGKTFPDFVADYRVGHAQKLMKEHPEMVLADVGDECGFSNEQSFFRTFKARIGVTPQEWKQNNLI